MSAVQLKLGDALDKVIDHRGRTPKKLGGEWANQGHRVISALNVKDHRIDDNDHHYVSDELYERWMKVPLRAGDVVLTSEAPLGEVAYLDSDTDWCLGQRLFALRAKPDVLDGRYLFYLLRGGPVRDQVLSRASGSTVSGIRQAELVRVSLDLPTISVQRDIASTLGALDDKIESNRRTGLLLEEATQARFTSLFNIEQKNEGVSLSALLEISPRRALKKGELATYIGMADLPTNSALVAEWGVKPFGSGQRFQNGDVLMARITPCLENGKTAVVDMLEAGEVGWGSTEYIVLNARAPLSTPWVYCLARSDAIRAFAIRNMSGSSGRLRFPASAFDKYLIDPPDHVSTSLFNSFAIPAFNRMAALRDENRTLVRLRDALLPELLSGRICVAEAWKPVEAQL